MPGTLLCALRAADALGIVDPRQIVHYVDGFMLAGSLAELTADTADIAELPQRSALFLRGAGYHNVLIVRHRLNDPSGAGSGTGHTADALLMIYLGNAVLHGDCALRTGLNAVAKAQTAIAAVVGAVA